ncbi:MAG: hypothetical protein QM495_12765 [Lutibacter sp.]|uniref:hypothetical protein n=1 Tax=Lutibacter sp. TaxID=1925666 RepID=UPI003859CF71
MKNILIRLLYLIPLLIFIFGFITSRNELNSMSSFGAEYLYIFLIPTIIFLYQTIRNSIVGWILVLILYFAYLGIWVKELIEMYDLVGAKYEYVQYFTFWIYVIIYLGIGLIYYIYRPKKILI